MKSAARDQARPIPPATEGRGQAEEGVRGMLQLARTIFNEPNRTLPPEGVLFARASIAMPMVSARRGCAMAAKVSVLY